MHIIQRQAGAPLNIGICREGRVCTHCRVPRPPEVRLETCCSSVKTVRHQLIKAWQAEECPQPPGWDFSNLEPRMTESTEPWELSGEYRAALRRATRVLDMGTGGGEYLLSFADLLPADTVATEAWSPNVAAAQHSLAPYGIDVVEYGAPDDDVDALSMPFEDGRFDLVLNRHESYSPREVARVLEPEGMFLTQQVGGDECGELAEWLGAHNELPQVNLTAFRDQLQEAGFQVLDGAEHIGAYTFDDVGALVAYLQLVPWETPDDFTVAGYADRLLTLHESTGGGPLVLTRKRFWIKAQRI